MPSIFKASIALCLLSFLTTGETFAKGESKIVTRVDIAIAQLKGGKLTVTAQGMANCGGFGIVVSKGRLVRRGELLPNKDGLIEYELQFSPPAKPSDKLNPVKASITERLSSGEVKGARVFAELNQMDALLPAAKEKKKK